ncbi:relaxase/mobilization nuclease domain-containing protein [Vibrio sp. 10N.261.52.F3]|uniref:relaxase/mobilization nuclease domain-containing protein n=1 Tax=Vibrio sp. 10N.261.52.F3 TaxID=3229683 RepID=UPI00354C9FF0
MKAKVKRGNGFRGTLNYVLDEGKKRTGDKDPEIVAGNMSATSAKALTKEFGFSRRLRGDIKNPVWHCSIALPKGERLSTDRWDRVVNRFLEEMGIDTGKHQFVAVRHNDTDNDHVHIVASRIGLNSKVWHGKNDVFNAIEATQALEKEFGLTLTAGYFELDANGKKVRRATAKKKAKPQEIQMSARTGEAPKRLVLQQVIDEATSSKTDVFSFIEQLQCAGVIVRPNVAKTGRLNGFSFELDGIPFKGSDLGDDYKWKDTSKLKNNISYEQNTDGARLIAVSSRIKEEDRKRSEESAKAEEARQSAHIENNDRDSAKHDSVSAGLGKEQPSIAKSPAADSHQQQKASNNNAASSNRAGQSNSEHNQPDGDSHQPSVQRTGQSNQQPAKNPALTRLENEVGDLRSRAGKWNAVNNTAGDLAAPIASNTGTSKQSPDQLKKVNAWREQHEALNAEQYRITLIPRKTNANPWVIGKKGNQETFFTAVEVEAKIPLMRQKNAQGYDIYITPMDEGNHYIVVDDLTTAEHMKMSKEGYKPTLVQESSKDNRQAIFKVAKTGDPEEQAAANAVVVELNRKHGDKNFSGVVHPFRMAGFSNKKAGRNNAFTRILSASQALCTKVSDKLKQAVGTLVARRDETDLKHRVSEINNVPKFAKDTPSLFRREWLKQHGLAKKMGWEIDYSRIDFRATKELLSNGIAPEDAQAAILECSPSVDARKNNPEDYAKRTVDKVQAEVSKPKPEPQAKPEAPKQKRAKRDKNGTIIGWIED